MVSKPHSKTVRGTFDNPKTKEAIESGKPKPQLGDPTSLKPETGNSKNLPSNDTSPPRGQGKDTKEDPGAPTVSDPYREGGADTMGSGSTEKQDLPHSKRVRGTLANSDGKSVNKTQLGDPASLKAETSNTKLDQKTESEGQEKNTNGKSKL